MNVEPQKTENNARLSVALRGAPRRLWRMLRRNWPWKLLALFLAICLWAGLISQDPTLTRERLFTDVTLSVTGADSLRRNSGLIVMSGLDDEALTARMRVDVPQREYASVNASYYNPRVDLTRITDTGEQTIKVSTTSSTTYGTVTSVSPETITVTVDEYVTNYRVPVTVNLTGEYPEGFYGTPPSRDPSAVAVSGPKTVVDQIARVYVDLDVSRLPAREGEVRTALPMRFVDRDGNDVESDMLEVSSADVVLRTIIVEQSLYPTRMLQLNEAALVEGEPAEGYSVISVSVTPDTLLAAGAEAQLDMADELFIDSPVDVTGRSESFSATVRARKPSELAYVSTDTITVTVEIEPVMVSRSFSGIRLATRGNSTGMKVSLDQRQVDVVVTGPQLVLDGLRASYLTAYADVSDLEAGQYELPIAVYLEERDMTDVTCVATPSTVTVTLKEK